MPEGRPPRHTELTRRQALAAGAALAAAAAAPVAASPNAAVPPPERLAVKEHPVDFACCRCGGTNVTRDAWTEWDSDAQEWVLAAVYDHAYCHDCDDDTRLDEVAIVPGSNG
ncbi:MAG: hypothetical protein QOE79_1978 [Sphingomonadales bacterium]|jgi:predicted RNA-binding Zn-ribbon protein involved in translation (DUF1610 family)|nr:hypothetical protein [Sphingomonadales bacterium]